MFWSDWHLSVEMCILAINSDHMFILNKISADSFWLWINSIMSSGYHFWSGNFDIKLVEIKSQKTRFRIKWLVKQGPFFILSSLSLSDLITNQETLSGDFLNENQFCVQKIILNQRHSVIILQIPSSNYV